jgi:hypothetical protein
MTRYRIRERRPVVVTSAIAVGGGIIEVATDGSPAEGGWGMSIVRAVS